MTAPSTPTGPGRPAPEDGLAGAAVSGSGPGPRVGLVGAGPWATMVQAPVIASTPGLELAMVWARRPEAARELAGRYGATAAGDPDALFAACDAVAFAVPPAVQAELASRAARAGCHLLLDKPVAGDLDAARRLAVEVADAGVASMLMLSWRYAGAVRDFLAAAAGFDAVGGAGRFLSGELLGGPFRTPWRLERGPLLDLAPHVIDLLDAALGPVATVRAAGDLARWVTLELTHESGAVSQAVVSGAVAVRPHRAGVEIYGAGGVLEVDCAAAAGPDAVRTAGAEFARVARGERHPLDVWRGVALQQVIHDAERQLLGSRW